MAHLERSVTLPWAVMYTLCVIIGAGIYALIGPAAGIAGNGVWMAFLFAALIAACTGLSYAELSSMMPYDAAEYIYAEKAFKSKTFAFTLEWTKLVTTLLAAATVSLGFGGYFSGLFNVHSVIGALIIVVFSMLLNFCSVKNTMKASAFFVVVTVIGLFIVLFGGFSYIGTVNYFEMTFGWSGVFSAAALVFFAFLGFENAAVLSEETKHPKKILPEALMIAIAISTLIYTFVALVSISAVPWNVLSASNSPLSLVASVIIGESGSLLISVIALIATGSTVIVLIFACSRMIFGMAEKRCFPSIFLNLSRMEVPYIAVATVGIITSLLVLIQDIKFVASITDFGALFVFMVVNLALIALRYRRSHLHGEFRVPLNIGNFPLLPAIGAAFSFFMLTELNFYAAVSSILFIVTGMILFTFIFKKRSFRQS